MATPTSLLLESKRRLLEIASRTNLPTFVQEILYNRALTLESPITYTYLRAQTIQKNEQPP